MPYNDIMKMPLKDFYDLLRIRSEEERRRAEAIKEQQENMNKQMNTNKLSANNKSRRNFFGIE